MTANDSDVSDGDTLTGSQVVRVYGNNLTAPFIVLTFGEVEYTPLTQGEGYIEFILGDNGTATINVDGSRFMSFEVEGNVAPSWLPTRILAYQKNDTSRLPSEGSYINDLIIPNTDCINYPYVANSDYPYFLFIFKGEEGIERLFEFENCESNTYIIGGEDARINVRILDERKPAWISYQGFIVAVFNYTTD